MSGRPTLRIDWASHKAAMHAVTHWHYTGSMPPGARVTLGAWEDDTYVGCIVFARGASRNLLRPYRLKQTEGCELVRVAMRQHATPISRMMRFAFKHLKQHAPSMRLIVSFADPAQGHHGGIYQAGGWIYAGQTNPTKMFRGPDGKLWHNRMVSVSGQSRVYGKVRCVLRPSQCEIVNMPGKHRYLMPLDREMRQRVASLSKPYPPASVGSADSGTLPVQGRGGGASPTSTLQPCNISEMSAATRKSVLANG